MLEGKRASACLNGSHPLPPAVDLVVPVPAWPNVGPGFGAGAIGYSVGESGGTGVSRDLLHHRCAGNYHPPLPVHQVYPKNILVGLVVVVIVVVVVVG